MRVVVRLVVTLLVLLTVSFLLVRLIPGDPVRASLGFNVSEESVEQRRAALGLDGSLWDQYVGYWQQTLSLDFGTSVTTNLPVSSSLEARWSRTLTLVVFALPLTLVVSVGVGLATAIAAQNGRRPHLRNAYRVSSATLAVIPDFFYAIGLVVVFAIQLDWLPAGGTAGLTSYILPVIAMTIGPAAAISRLVHARSTEVLDAPFMVMARSQRLPPRAIYVRHALPNVLLEAMTLGGLYVGTMVAGSVVVEVVFNINGIGSLLIQAMIDKDYPVIQACLLILGTVVLVAHAFVDVALARLDPRSTIGEAR
jgi:peptide/nickel transport system permease protein